VFIPLRLPGVESTIQTDPLPDRHVKHVAWDKTRQHRDEQDNPGYIPDGWKIIEWHKRVGWRVGFPIDFCVDI